MKLHFEHALPGVETIVQSKAGVSRFAAAREIDDGQVVALREARVTYIEGRLFHAYWRIRLG